MSNVEINEDTDLEIEALGEAIQTRTERLVNRANRLLEIATPLTELWKEEDYYIPPTPPVSGGTGSSFDFPGESSGLNWEFSSSAKGRQMSVATTGADSLGSVASSISDDSLNPANQGLSNWALSRLNATHDALLSHLAAYIGRLHLQSRSPGQIFETTNQCVTAARSFLGVVRAITSRKGNRLSSTGALEQASTSLWNKCTTLVNVAREVVSAHGVDDTEDVVMDTEVRKLVEAATACVRSAGKCVALGHCLLEAMGDFELPPTSTKLARESLVSLGPAEDYPPRRPSLTSSKILSKQLPEPPLSEDNPRRPLPSPPQHQSPTRKIPPKLKLVSSHTAEQSKIPTTPGSSSARAVIRPTSPLRLYERPPPEVKQQDSESQHKFIAGLRQANSNETLAQQSQEVEELQVPSKPEIVEPSPSSSPRRGPVRHISHPQLNRNSLFRSENDEMHLADTLKMPRIGSSSSSSNVSGEAGDEQSMKSVPTTPEPGTPVRAVTEVPKSIILNSEGQVLYF